ncbi:hypothetical protein B0H66DRAFT_148431 [Apodospora peruviana]|uniref:Uncharacterized protein n=1 Tax=Apodospora peruviana TaxID=516989 RepID=A0AAE0IJJ3_9PEZI|nr:hypothetical protein B0H66DRAFT_148431 [Apodospora peruviana]
MRQTLRGPPPRPALGVLPTSTPRPLPSSNYLVESWLDNIPQTALKPSAEENDHWRVDHGPGIPQRKWRRLFNQRSMRAASLFFAVLILILILSFIGWESGNANIYTTLILCPLVILWNVAEYILTRNRRGISPKVRVFVDSVLCLAAACAAGFLLADVLWWTTGSYNHPTKITCVVFSISIMLIHSFLLIFFIIRCRENRSADLLYAPKIMYLQTGGAVLVTPHPVVTRPVRFNPRIELTQLRTTSIGSQADPSSRNRSTEHPRARIHEQPVTGPTRAAPSPAIILEQPVRVPAQIAQSSSVAPPISPQARTSTSTDVGRGETPRQGVPKRKPVASAKPVGTHYATPWPCPDYQPDDAERERAVRGESQAQWMTLHGMHLTRADTTKGQGQAAH